jgi:hypothetical protein
MEENIEVKKDDGLPDSENCRAREHANFNYELVDCLIEHPLCDFALLFGSNLMLCRHPRRKEIVERTKAMLDGSEKSV